MLDFHLMINVVLASVAAAALYFLLHRAPAAKPAKSKRALDDAAAVASAVPAAEVFPFTSIGIVSSVFRRKYGAPRQGSVIPTARAIVTLHASIPKETLEGLEGYSHVWLLFIFSANTNKKFRARVEPPRLGGAKVGIFACRTPHRVNPLGMSAVKLDRVDVRKRQLHVSGVDLIDNTPIVDIKPYHSADCMPHATQPEWMQEVAEYPLTVTFAEQAQTQLRELVAGKKLRFYHTYDEICAAISESASLDPRPVYLRKRASKDEVYGYDLDRLNIQHTIDEEQKLVTIVAVFLYPHDGRGKIQGEQLVE